MFFSCIQKPIVVTCAFNIYKEDGKTINFSTPATCTVKNDTLLEGKFSVPPSGTSVVGFEMNKSNNSFTMIDEKGTRITIPVEEATVMISGKTWTLSKGEIKIASVVLH